MNPPCLTQPNSRARWPALASILMTLTCVGFMSAVLAGAGAADITQLIGVAGKPCHLLGPDGDQDGLIKLGGDHLAFALFTPWQAPQERRQGSHRLDQIGAQVFRVVVLPALVEQ